MEAESYSAADMMHIIAEQALYISKLEQQNKQLRVQLAVRQPSPSGAPSVPVAPTRADLDNPEMIVENYENFKYEHTQLLCRYRALENQHAGCERRHQEDQRDVARAKSSVKAWRDYINRKHQSRQGIVMRGSSEVNDKNDDLSGPANSIENNHPIENDPARNEASGLRSSPPRIPQAVDGDVPPLPAKTAVSRLTSSQTTVLDEQEKLATVRVKDEPPSSDSEPIFIASRSLKRKSDGRIDERPVMRIKQEANSPENAIPLISEDYSSPGLPAALSRNETLDLDTVTPVLKTPRRLRRSNPLLPRANSAEPVRGSFRLARSDTSLSDGHSDMKACLSRHSTGFDWLSAEDKTGKQDVGLELNHNDDATAQHERADVLQPISANVSRAYRGNEKTKRRRTEISDKVGILSEDGDNASQTTAPASKIARETTPQARTDSRLETMLNEPSSGRAALSPRRPPIVTYGKRRRPQLPQAKTPVSAIKCSPQPARRSELKKPIRDHARSPPPVQPEEEPLRLRPPQTLRLEDFRVNPAYLGTDFAFADPIRGKEQRKGLHACTRPDCCGGVIGKTIQAFGRSLSGKTDAQALESYLGPDWENLFKLYAPEERDDIVHKAHTWALSKEHGTHRHAFERPASPPGFWRTDMPTTQEAAEDRQKALEMIKAQVEERWREAMREGGRYKFRDE